MNIAEKLAALFGRPDCVVRLFDIETDGLLPELTKVHLLVIKDPVTKERWVFRRNSGMDTISLGIAMLAAADYVVAHNGIGFDAPALQKTHGLVMPRSKVIDSMVLSRLVWPELATQDMAFRKKKAGSAMPGNLVGLHSIEAWGYRLGQHKGDYRGDSRLVQQLMEDPLMNLEEAWKLAYARRWEEWNPDMEEYGIQDVEVLDALFTKILSKDLSPQSVQIETQVAHILARQERYGFRFNERKAALLQAKLAQRRLELEDEVRAVFKPRFLPDGPAAGRFVPKRDNVKAGYVEGAVFTKVKLTEFNPSSRDHVARWLRLEYGWAPEEFTADGKPKVDDEVISKLPYPEAKPLKEYFVVVKRLGQVAEGKEAWLKKAGKDGRMHGRVNTLGAATRRMTHSGPNMAQVPASYSPYGHDCRELFEAGPGMELVGIDADALELRDLAGFMARFDGGAYIQTVLSGDKSKGTDMHSVNCRALGMDPKEQPFLAEGDKSTGRDLAKTWFYAFIYGAGDEKLGFIVTKRKGAEAKKRGAADREKFLKNLPAMGKLVSAVKEAVRTRGYLLALDKAVLPVRSQHAALNTLLQSAGAVQMKKALCILDDDLQATGLQPGVDYEFVANVHDEWQIECRAGLGETIGRMGADAVRKAGEFFGFLCPLAGAFEVGHSWADTH